MRAQTPPTVYTITVVNSMFGPPITMTTYRNGSKAIMDHFDPSQASGALKPQSRQLIDLDKHTTVSWSLIDSSGGCGTGSFSGDWGDPFSGASDLTGQGAKVIGKETVLGYAATVYEANLGTNGTVKAWIDLKTGLVLKGQLTPPGGAPQTIVEVKSVSFTAPPASIFAVPAICAAAAAAPPPPTEAQQIAALTGDDAQNYVKAIYGPGSKNSCTVLYRVVGSGSMAPVTAFQVAIDLTANQNHMPSYTIGLSDDLHSTFQGGGLHEVTSQLRNGVLHIDNAPEQFELETTFLHGSGASGLIYRQCFGPQTVLLYVMKNPDKGSDGGEWLWVKSGKYATLPH
jgi:hypothetical protein